MSSNPGSSSIWIVSSFVTQRADLHPEYLACLLRTPPALLIKERRDVASIAHCNGGHTGLRLNTI